MIAEVSYHGNAINAEIKLPSSKSISNRVLIVHALGNLQSEIQNLSEANDTLQLEAALASQDEEVNAGDGGTTLRFLMAYYCASGKEVILTASEAMRKRPVSLLVDSLRLLGASIEYIQEEGKLPVRISRSSLTGKKIEIDGAVSSQFISALMLIAPYIPGGITIEITGEMLSLPYIQMTQSVMQYFGAKVSFENTLIKVEEGKYTGKEISIEPDWSAASYWYEIAAVNTHAVISLPGLTGKSLQGDSAISNMMDQLGVKTEFNDAGATISNNALMTLPDYFSDDFSGCPDLGPAVAATCAALNIKADLFGLKNFRLKESDRAAALQRELYNMNVKTDFCGGSKFKLYPGDGLRKYLRPVKTYHDHRIAMTFAPLAIKTGMVIIDDCEVVNKSYPGFYSDLEKAGFFVIFR